MNNLLIVLIRRNLLSWFWILIIQVQTYLTNVQFIIINCKLVHHNKLHFVRFLYEPKIYWLRPPYALNHANIYLLSSSFHFLKFQSNVCTKNPCFGIGHDSRNKITKLLPICGCHLTEIERTKYPSEFVISARTQFQTAKELKLNFLIVLNNWRAENHFLQCKKNKAI